MWNEPLDPTNPRHQALLFAATAAAITVAVLVADGLIPAIVRWQIGGGL